MEKCIGIGGINCAARTILPKNAKKEKENVIPAAAGLSGA